MRPAGNHGEVAVFLAGTGYHSEANVEHCQRAGIEPLMPSSRERHKQPFTERFADDPAPPNNPNPDCGA